MYSKLRNIIFIFLFSLSVFVYLRFPEETGLAVREALDRCLEIMIPSMFAFMCICCIITETGLHHVIGRPFRFISEKVFRLPQGCFSIFLLSMISGYPAGEKLIFSQLDKGCINRQQADRMSLFCFASGPAFISGTTASILFKDSNAGLIIFLSITCSNVILSLITAAKAPAVSGKRTEVKTEITASAFVSGINSAASAMLKMCVMIIAFSSFYKIAELAGINGILEKAVEKIFSVNSNASKAIVSSFFEISCITTFPKYMYSMLPLITALLSFGGVCVLLQIISVSGQRIPVGKFLVGRLFSSAVSAAICRMLMPWLECPSIAVSGNFSTVRSASPFPSVLLIIMTMLLLTKSHGQKRI